METLSHEQNPDVKPQNFFFRNKTESQAHKTKVSPIQITYNVYLCSYFANINNTDNGAWCALISSQEEFCHQVQARNGCSAYMLTNCTATEDMHQFRLKSIRDCLNWIISGPKEQKIGLNFLEINLTCNDVFITNLLRDWIPIWNQCELNTDSSNTEEQELRPKPLALRPYSEILLEISDIVNKVKKIEVKWLSEASPEMKNLDELNRSMIKKMNSKPI